MKRKILRGYVAAVTAILIVIVPLLSVAATAKDEKCPRIWVHGFMSSTVYDDVDDPDSLPSWPPTEEEITAAVKESIPVFAEFALTKDWDDFGKSMGDVTAKLFSRAMNNPDGTVKEGSGIRFKYPSKSKIKADSDIYFKYDWREDPIKIAGQLNDFINYVLDVSGCDQVALTCHSFGGVVATTYFTLYGCDKVRTVVFNSTAIYGETYTGELMSGKLHFSGDAITDYMFYAFKGTEYEHLINAAFEALDATGLLDTVTDLLNGLSSHIQNEVCARSVVPLFGGWLPVWAMVPDEYMDDAMDFVFNTIYKDSETDYSALKSKVENYNNLVRSKKAETLKAVNEKCNVYVITRYGYSSLPITPSASNMGDGIIDVKYASFGATAAPFGSTLENADVTSPYVSPDRTVDASTCLFPEQTWFVKYMKHGSKDEALNEMMRTFMKYDGQGTVEDFDKYPRFTVFDGEKISPEFPIQNDSTLFDKLRLIINDIIKLVKTIINNVK